MNASGSHEQLPAVETLDLTYKEDVRRHGVDQDCELYFEVDGEGPSVTFVSSIYVVSTAWRNFTRRLRNHHRLLTYDLRNQGASSGVASGFAQHTEDLKSLLDGLGIARTHLVGTSISTVICRDFAARYPEKVSSLVLIGPPFSPLGSTRRDMITKSWLTALELGGPRQLFDTMYPLVFGDRVQALGGASAYVALRERFLAVNSASQLRANLAEALNSGSDAEILGKISAPALLLAGDDDFCVGPTSLRALADLMPNGRAEVFADCGHLPFFEATHRFEALLLEFFASACGDSE
jgi:pimeloyl-ACP methyl ester carboxylesterase